MDCMLWVLSYGFNRVLLFKYIWNNMIECFVIKARYALKNFNQKIKEKDNAENEVKKSKRKIH